MYRLADLVGAGVNRIEMDIGGVPREEYVETEEVIGREVIPLLNMKPSAMAATA